MYVIEHFLNQINSIITLVLIKKLLKKKWENCEIKSFHLRKSSLLGEVNSIIFILDLCLLFFLKSCTPTVPLLDMEFDFDYFFTALLKRK